MATTVARLEAVLGADTSGFDRAMDKSEKRTHGFGSALGGMAKTAALAGGAAGLGALAYGLKIGIGEFTQSQKVAAQTEAVLKSTGGVANVTAKQVTGLATALMKKSGTDDEAIASGENLLLTFKNIRNEVGKGNDIFTQATKATLDLSVAFHKDMHSSAILVGKALNDPIKGLTALQRVGVTFTAAQKEQIKALEDSGHHLQAQKIIMGELKSEVGGSAEAYGKTLPGMISIARESFNNWAGDLVKKMIPTITRLVNFIRENWPQISATIHSVWVGTIKPVLGAMTDIILSVVGVVRDNWSTIGPIVVSVAKIIRSQIKFVTEILQTLAALLRGDWSEAWEHLQHAIGAVIEGIKTEIQLGFKLISGVFDAIGSLIAKFPGEVVNFVALLKTKIVGWIASADIGGYFSSVVGGWVSFVTGMPGRVTDFIAVLKKKIVGFFTSNAIGDYISSVVGGWVGFITGLPGRVGDFVVTLKNKIVGFFIDNDIGGYITSVVAGWIGTIGDLPGKAGAAITAGAKAIKKAVTDLFGNVIDWVKKALGISSPSAVFHEMGRQSVQGFINGVGSMAGVLKNAVVGMVKSLPGKALGAVEGAVGAIGGEIKSAPGEHSVGSAEKYLVPWAQQEGITVTSIAGGNHVKGSYHYQHRAIDVDGGYAKNRDFFADSINHFGAKNITELFFDPMGYYIKNGQRIKGAIGGHGDHVHIALDKGGWLPTGTNLITNNTGRPERVLGPGEGGMVVINYNGTIIHEREAEQRIVDLLQRAQRRGPLGLSGGFA